ncbi:Rhodanese-related sulfurtransferase [hydrothermal vent metagenome]|uniref:Rhodanese-related sulfurtransferase n=1 Tax=hydrothermal vent metagenome TaxID=652676 RepID=A0A3B0TU71_9ZZZZ
MKKMTINDAVKLIAGVFIIISLALGYYLNETWYLFTVFVGLNLAQSAFTKWCLMEKILKKAGMKAADDNCNC